MKKFNMGDKVTYSKSVSKWYLNNSECFVRPSGEYDNSFDDYMQISLTHLLGEPIIGIINNKGALNSYQVVFNMNGWEFSAYVESKYITRIK